MVHIKKILIFVTAFLLALLAAEFFTSKIINYPKYGVDKKVLMFEKLRVKTKIYLPHSEYWTVEGGNKVYRRNNLGLPGIDVRTNQDSKNIFILGSSFVESLSVPPENMAASRFQMLLNKDNNGYRVLNLGSAGYNVYTDYFRSVYYEKYYEPDNIFLVMHTIYENYKLEPDFFEISSEFGRADNSFKFFISKEILNRSAFLNLLTAIINKPAESETIIENVTGIHQNLVEKYRNTSLNNLEICFKKFRERYGNKFIVVSMLTEENNSDLRILCGKIGVNFISDNILGNQELRFNNVGHLNEKGSTILSNLLYEAFIKFNKK